MSERLLDILSTLAETVAYSPATDWALALAIATMGGVVGWLLRGWVATRSGVRSVEGDTKR